MPDEALVWPEVLGACCAAGSEEASPAGPGEVGISMPASLTRGSCAARACSRREVAFLAALSD